MTKPTDAAIAPPRNSAAREVTRPLRWREHITCGCALISPLVCQLLGRSLGAAEEPGRTPRKASLVRRAQLTPALQRRRHPPVSARPFSAEQPSQEASSNSGSVSDVRVGTVTIDRPHCHTRCRQNLQFGSGAPGWHINDSLETGCFNVARTRPATMTGRNEGLDQSPPSLRHVARITPHRYSCKRVLLHRRRLERAYPEEKTRKSCKMLRRTRPRPDAALQQTRLGRKPADQAGHHLQSIFASNPFTERGRGPRGRRINVRSRQSAQRLRASFRSFSMVRTLTPSSAAATSCGDLPSIETLRSGLFSRGRPAIRPMRV